MTLQRLLLIATVILLEACSSGEPSAPEPAGATATVESVPTAALSTSTPTQSPTSTATALSRPADTSIHFAWRITGDPHPLDRPVGVTVDPQGNVLIVDTKNSRIQKFDTNGNFIMTWGSHGDGDGQFNIVTSSEGRIAVDTLGNVYVADVDNYRIQKFDSQGGFLTKWGTEGSGDGQFKTLSDLEVDISGSVYAVDRSNNSVQKFDSDGNFLLSWGTLGTNDGELTGIQSLAIDASETVHMCDVSNRVQSFDSDGNFLMLFHFDVVEGKLVDCTTLAVDTKGHFYILDQPSHRVIKLDENGKLLAVWGNQGTENGQFRAGQDIVVDEDGNVYVTDSVNDSVQKFYQP